MKKIILFLLLLFPFSAFAQQTINPAAIPFSPGQTLSISVTSSPSAGQLVGVSFTPTLTSAQVMVTNTGANVCFVAFGATSAVSATTSSTPIPAGAIEIFTINQNSQYVSAVTSSSTTTCYFTAGVGN